METNSSYRFDEVNGSFHLNAMQGNSLAITKFCEIDGKTFKEKAKYRSFEELFNAEKGNRDLIIGVGKHFFYVLNVFNMNNNG